MPPTTKVSSSNEGVFSPPVQSEHDNSKGNSIRPLEKEDQSFDAEGKFPSGWWIVPLLFIGVIFWIMVAFWIFI